MEKRSGRPIFAPTTVSKQMKILLIAVIALFLLDITRAEDFNYRRVLMAGTGNIGNLFVRYLYSSETPCIFIQNLVPGGKGTVAAQKKICSINGKSFYDGYADVDFKRGTFENDKLSFEVGLTPLEPAGERIVNCEVVFIKGLADHLSCKN